jgi:hypothetical protein
MKERGILFSSPMVRSILDGRKNQTRRIVKPQPTFERDGLLSHPKLAGHFALHVFGPCMAKLVPCPYGAIGDRLYVKEAIVRVGQRYKGRDAALYEADYAPTLLDSWPWQRPRLPGMFLPRGLSRITLEITGLRVELLQAITEVDAAAEGVERDTAPCDHTRQSCEDVGCMGPTYRSTFAELWAAINGADSWKANPWVWVVEFKRIEARP